MRVVPINLDGVDQDGVDQDGGAPSVDPMVGGTGQVRNGS
jgi:hypothetical protein